MTSARCVALLVCAFALAVVPAVGSAGTASTGTVAIRIKVPSRSSAGSRMAPRYVSVSTESFGVLTDGKNLVVGNVNPGAQYVTVYLRALAGMHTFTVTAYDRPGGHGNVLSTGTTGPVAVPAVGTANLSLALGGVVTSVALALNQNHPTIGWPATIFLGVTAKDSDGNVVLGVINGDPTGATFAQPFVLTSSDPVNGKLSQTVVAAAVNDAPNYFARITVTYSGANVGAITFSASGGGLSSVTPAVLAPLPPPATGEQIVVTGGFDPNSAYSTTPGNQFLGTFGTPPAPLQSYDGYRAAAADLRAGVLYVPDFLGSNPRMIDVYQTTGGYRLLDAFSPQMFAGSLAIDSAAGRLYVADSQSATIAIFTTGNGHARVGQFSSGILGGANIALDPGGGRLFAGGTGLSPRTGVTVFKSSSPYNVLGSFDNANYARGIAAAAGRVFVLEVPPYSASAYVDVFATSNLSTPIGRIGPLPAIPEAIAVDGLAARLFLLTRTFVGQNVSVVSMYGLDPAYSYLGSFPATSGSEYIAVARYAP